MSMTDAQVQFLVGIDSLPGFVHKLTYMTGGAPSTGSHSVGTISVLLQASTTPDLR